MHILLIYREGRVSEGLLLSSTPGRMRVMLPGLADVLEFAQVDGAWMSESGASVEIAAAMPAQSPAEVADTISTTRRMGLASSQAGCARAN